MRNLLGVAVIGLAIGAPIVVAGLDSGEVERSHHRYCEAVVTWESQARQGIHPYDRHGHPDYKGIAAEQCTGMRPAQ